jgi:cold shock CspA family protein
MDHQSIEVFDRTGRVASFDARKGYGFIEAVGPAWEVGDLEGAGIGVHDSVIQGPGYRALRDGQAVRFDAVRRGGGWTATRVQRIAGEGPDDPGTPGVGAAPGRPPGLL